MIGASAALALSGIPFNGPIGAARVGYLNGDYVLNPTASELKESQLNLVVAGTQQAVLMVESEADELSEEIMLGAVVFGHEQMQRVIDLINELADQAGKPLWDWTTAKDQALIDKIASLAEGRSARGLLDAAEAAALRKAVDDRRSGQQAARARCSGAGR